MGDYLGPLLNAFYPPPDDGAPRIMRRKLAELRLLTEVRPQLRSGR